MGWRAPSPISRILLNQDGINMEYHRRNTHRICRRCRREHFGFSITSEVLNCPSVSLTSGLMMWYKVLVRNRRWFFTCQNVGRNTYPHPPHLAL